MKLQLLIPLLSIISLTTQAQTGSIYPLLLKGEKVLFDSAIVVPLATYRLERDKYKQMEADADRSQAQIHSLLTNLDLLQKGNAEYRLQQARDKKTNDELKAALDACLIGQKKPGKRK